MRRREYVYNDKVYTNEADLLDDLDGTRMFRMEPSVSYYINEEYVGNDYDTGEDEIIDMLIEAGVEIECRN